jgi:hypothetical protein
MPVTDGFAIHEPPDAGIEAAELVLRLQKCFGALYGCRDLQAIADDSCIRHQGCRFALRVAGDLAGVEVVEGDALVLPLAQNRQPAQPGLRAFDDKEFGQSGGRQQKSLPAFASFPCAGQWYHVRLFRSSNNFLLRHTNQASAICVAANTSRRT